MTAKPPPIVQVENAEQVNVPPPAMALPYGKVIAAVSFFILIAFTAVTFYVLFSGDKTGIDAATKGAIIQTWNNLAIAAAMFWVGSSLGGKMTAGAKP